MRKSALYAALLASTFLSRAAFAQGCGQQNPNCIVPTAPLGTNNNQAASTAFVNQNALGSALPSGDLFVGNASNLAVAQALSGDCTITNAGAITCTKTGGVAFAPSATTDTTNAGNISSGTLPAGRMPALTGDVTSSAGTTTTTLAWISRVAGKSETFNNSIVWAGTDGTTMTFPSSSATIAALNLADQTLTGGANVTALNLGTLSSGTTTIDCGARSEQFLTNNGAFTLAAPSNDGSCFVMSINSGSASTISFSGFSVGSNTGDPQDVTNGHKFTISIWRINGTSGYRLAAHQ